MDAIRKIEEMPPLPDLPATRNRFEVAFTLTGERLDYTANQMHTYAREYAAQTLASKEAELVRLREALGEVQRVLVRENGRENGAIVDTIWRSPHETLFDYIESALTTQPTE